MSQAKEVRNKITSIKSTQKITRAMELVAASKMRRAQERMAKSKPYSEKIRQVIAHVASSHSEYQHEFLKPRDVKSRVGYIVVTTDRGLCGGLNVNLFRALLKQMRDYASQDIGVDLCLIGRKGEAYFSRFDANISGVITQLGDTPELADLIGVVKVMLDSFKAGKLDHVYLASNDFINTMVQKPVIRQLLPVVADQSQAEGHWDYIYEPDSAKEILEALLRRYVESQVYQAVIENIACEQSARMVAMKSATENAGDIIKELQLIYNKARQASITQEIAEIVGGAAAIE